LPLRLATRGSPLALWQARFLAARLSCPTELVVVDTAGDKRQDRPIWELGGQGVFVKEIQAAVLEGRADAAVHSAKDLPSRAATGLVIAAVPERADPRDVLVGARLYDLAPGAVVATGSVRRRAQLAWIRPDLTFHSLRGNIATRLDRIPPGGAIVMAAAALHRLDLRPPVCEALALHLMLPQVGQGAIAVECREADVATRESLRVADDPVTHRCVDAERAFLARLGGSCELPVGAHATLGPDDTMRVEGLLASLDGRSVLRSSALGPAEAGADLGTGLAEELLASGGSALLADAGLDLR
jgi:hydroxymethylbilane synthase